MANLLPTFADDENVNAESNTVPLLPLIGFLSSSSQPWPTSKEVAATVARERARTGTGEAPRKLSPAFERYTSIYLSI